MFHWISLVNKNNRILLTYIQNKLLIDTVQLRQIVLLAPRRILWCSPEARAPSWWWCSPEARAPSWWWWSPEARAHSPRGRVHPHTGSPRPGQRLILSLWLVRLSESWLLIGWCPPRPRQGLELELGVLPSLRCEGEGGVLLVPDPEGRDSSLEHPWNLETNF